MQIIEKIKELLKMKIDSKYLSIIRGVGIGAVIAAYITLCFAQFIFTLIALLVAFVVDIVVIWQDFQTISARIHSWLGQKGDLAVNVLAFVLSLWFLRNYAFNWFEYGVASAFWIVHGHLWWYANRE